MKLKLLGMIVAVALAGCEHKTAEQKVDSFVGGENGIYALKAEERQMAENNAKQYFNRDFPQMQVDSAGNRTMGTARGMFLDCRPTDSNANGLVTCHGMMPTASGGFNDHAVRYCGYRKELVGCSDEDTVAK